MTISPQRRRALIWAAVALLAGAVVTTQVVASLNATESAQPQAPQQSSSSTSTTANTTSTSSTTSVVIQYQPLPPDTHEVATVRSFYTQVQVQAAPPAGWDQSLTPVISPAADPAAPRSAEDLARVPIPSVDYPVSGRAVTPTGWVLSNPGTYSPPQPLVFGVVSRQGLWSEVALPVRPNGTTGWIRSELLVLSTTQKELVISVADRSIRLLEAGQELFSAPISVGRPNTPTPTGSFYVTDIVPSINPTAGYGPVALALNGYSEAMDSFGGEDAEGAADSLAPVLAIHGTNRPDSIGRAASNGCPRLFNEAVLQLAALVPAGTPVHIFP